MLSPEYLDSVADELTALYYDLESDILADIAERLALNGNKMTTTAEYLTMKLEQMGYHHSYVRKRLADTLQLSEKQVDDILLDSTYTSMRDSLRRAKTYESVDETQITFDEQVLQSKTAINAELTNLTNTTAQMASNKMLQTFDDAYLKVSSGAYSLNQAVEQACMDLAGNGLGTVSYASGAQRHLDVAVRLAVRTGVNQNALACEKQLLDATEHNLVITTSHFGARPSHAEWQGRVFWRLYPEGDYENFEEATGYGTGAGLGGWNCRHSFYAYYPEEGSGIEPVNQAENKKVYELTQQQRYNERQIRKWKRCELIKKKAGQDTTKERQKVSEWKRRNDKLIRSSKYLKKQYSQEKIIDL